MAAADTPMTSRDIGSDSMYLDPRRVCRFLAVGIRFRAWGRAWVMLGLGLLASSASAHEPYLLLTLEGDRLAIEAGFSDRSSPEGLPLLVRDRSSGQVLHEYALPASGLLSIPIPAVGYRVVFEGGPGHRVSKPGPVKPSTPAEGVAKSKTSVAPHVTAAGASPQAVQPAWPPLAGDPAERDVIASTVGAADQRLRVASAVILFGAVSFGLGFWAGRPSETKSPSLGKGQNA